MRKVRNMKKEHKEISAASVIIGVILAITFGAANAYLGLRAGMTISASIPAAVVAMGIMRYVLQRKSVLETNIVQTIGSAGESVAAGSIFTLPALYIWAKEWGKTPPSFVEITMIALCGGILGVLFMVPLRRALIEKEDRELVYPEGKACAQVIKATDATDQAGCVFWGMGISAIYKFISEGLGIFMSEIHYSFKRFKGAGIGVDVLPALAGVGYICGPKIASYMLAGGVLTWFVLLPIIALFGGNQIMFPSAIAIAKMDSWQLWSSYIRYIGAGAVASAGLISLIKTGPMIVMMVRDNIRSVRNKADINEDRKDIPMWLVGLGILIIGIVIWLTPAIPVNIVGMLFIVIIGFFFATVSARMVGIVGSSNNPVSGMTIATLLGAGFLLKSLGNIGYSGMIMAIAIGSVICIIAAVAGDTSQDLKSGYILSATPQKQQIAELIGVIVSSVTIAGVLYLLDGAFGYGSAQLPAPQAMLMKLVVEGVMQGNLPWHLIFVGMAITVVMEILQLPVLPVAIGIYLPVHLSVPIFLGSMIKLIIEKKKDNESQKDTALTRGMLYCSGLIAGEGLIGILLAIFAVVPFKDGNLMQAVNISEMFVLPQFSSLLIFLILVGSIWYVAERRKRV